jgi:hypothetical protein
MPSHGVETPSGAMGDRTGEAELSVPAEAPPADYPAETSNIKIRQNVE